MHTSPITRDRQWADVTDASLLGPRLKRFLEEYLVSEHSLARNTELGYRDSLANCFDS